MKDYPKSGGLNPSLALRAGIRLYGSVVLTLAWYGMWTYSIVKYLPYMTKDWTVQIIIITAIIFSVFVVFPIVFFKPYRIFTDRTWDGIILDKNLKYYDLPDKGTSFEARFDREKVIVSAETDTGKTECITLRNELVTNADYYKKGDPIRHHRGLTYYEKLDKSGDRDVICLNCGRVNGIERSSCLNCGSGLQK
ncbi:MAG: hypothetical protein AB9835_12515 [Eubacteriales bacterium]